MKNFKTYLFLNIAIMVVGLTLCFLASFWLTNYFPFGMVLLTGLIGVTLTFLGGSLLVDLREIRELTRS
ncbi:MAG: hypothetical protein ACI83W_001721 [Marinoscillum sp.]|jgi:hypothetical protein